MKIVCVGLGRQDDMVRSLNTIGEVVAYIDCTKMKPIVFNQELMIIHKRESPHLYFFQIQHPGILSPSVAEYLTQTAVTINWTGDVRQPLPDWYIYLAPFIDMTLFTNMVDVVKMNRLNLRADYMQIGFPQYIFKKLDRNKIHDIVFMGANNGAYPLSDFRVRMVKMLKEKYQSDFLLCGNGWGDMYRGVRNVGQQEENELYNCSKIAINLSHFNYENYSSDRLWRIMGSGAMCLSHHYEGIEDEFVVGQHLDTWKTLEQLEAKISYYLEDSKKREEIAEAGYKFVHENCTWENRIMKVQEIYNERIKLKR